jgi:hypothetical protein
MLYLVKRTDVCKYDEYDAFVIRAESSERAVEIAKKRQEASGWTVRELSNSGEEEIILSDFNAG